MRSREKNSDSRKPTYLIWPQWVHAVSSYGQWISTNCAHYFNFPLGCIDFIFHTRVIHTSSRIFIKCTAIHIFRALKKRAQKRKKEMHEDLHRCMGYPKWIHKVTKRYVALYSNWHFNFIQFVPHFTILCTLVIGHKYCSCCWNLKSADAGPWIASRFSYIQRENSSSHHWIDWSYIGSNITR